MTLSSKYDQIMEHVRVTPQMRNRILKNASTPVDKKHKLPFPAKARKHLPLAACMVLILGLGLILPRALRNKQEEGPLVTAPINGMEEVGSLVQLEQAVGFEIREPRLPFTAEKQEYTSLWGTIAQIQYEDTAQNALFRQSKGEEDNSGDYNVYDQSLTSEGIIVMGNEGNGISEAIRQRITRRILIPNFHQGCERAESLNVAIATAITCSEFRRRQ